MEDGWEIEDVEAYDLVIHLHMLNVRPEDADVVHDGWVLVLLEHMDDDALECGSHIGEVGNAAANYEDLAVWAGHAACDEVGCHSGHW